MAFNFDDDENKVFESLTKEFVSKKKGEKEKMIVILFIKTTKRMKNMILLAFCFYDLL